MLLFSDIHKIIKKINLEKFFCKKLHLNQKKSFLFILKQQEEY